MTRKLEDFLRTELSQRTLDATDGFYQLSFEKLSIGLWNGELRLEGIELNPDSAVYTQWAEADSLPPLYVKLKIGLIDFNGVNLTWHRNYKTLNFHSFRILSPRVEVFSPAFTNRTAEEKPEPLYRKTLYEMMSPYINVLAVRVMRLNNAKVSYYIENEASPMTYALDDVSFNAYGFRLDSLSSKSGKLLYCDDFDFTTNHPQTLLSNYDFTLKTKKIELSTRDSIILIEDVKLVSQEDLWKERNERPVSSVDGSISFIRVDGIKFTREKALNYLKARSFQIHSSDLKAINLKKAEKEKAKTTQELTQEDAVELVNSLSLYDIISPILHSAAIDRIKIDQTRLNYTAASRDSSITYSIGNLDLVANGFLVDSATRFGSDIGYFQEVALSVTDISTPLDNGFYNLNVGRFDLRESTIEIRDIRLTSTFPKMQFAYRHPKHADWFDVRVGSVSLQEIDLPAYMEKQELYVKRVMVDSVNLQNFKNQQIIVPKKVIPMIYGGIQNVPVKFSIGELDITHFNVIYEELARKGTSPGKLYFTNMNGHVANFTNIAEKKDQFNRLDAEGYLMGKSYFTASWMLPVSPKYDRFLLQAELEDFDITALNELIVPLAGAEVARGKAHNVVIDMDANSINGTIRMRFPYRYLEVKMLKKSDDELKDNSFVSWMANAVVRSSNPNKPDDPKSKLREVHTTIVRDPHHSTFNYLWQMLRPAMGESVGISQGTQKAAAGVSKAFTGVKNFFNKKEKTPDKEKKK